MDNKNQRRAFIRYIALGSVGVGAAAMAAATPSEPKKGTQEPKVEKKPHFGMIFDQNKCVGCTDCEVACVKTNIVPKGQMRLFVQDKTDPQNRMDKRFVRISCQQCQDAPCVNVCPTNACCKDEKTGIVTMKTDDCIACKYCIVACPYDVRFINHETKAAESCNFCLDTKIEKGEQPACVESCRYDALVFGDVNDEESHISKLLRIKDSLRMRPECGTKPSLRYIPAVKMGV
ncbi:4Fe-4S dicluster domain-containing protein [Campylobacter sp. 9BO]|uniref:4Fe-4S dicluster domain-containing protein n=1 Tax=Campylobacter sp. 9BO TaxID=3424759 RepID=UPI003D332989